MKIRNKRNKANYVNFKSSGIAKKSLIEAGKTADISEITNVTQILNFGDFKRGFFEIVSEEPEKIEILEAQKAEEKVSKITKKKEDSLDKVKKEVQDYTDNKDNK